MKKSILLIDVDNTLLDFDLGERIALIDTLKELGLPYTEDVISAYHHLNIGVWEEFEKGLLTQDELVEKRFQLLLDYLGNKSYKDGFVNSLYSDYLSQQHHYLEGAEGFLERVSPMYRVILVSNGIDYIQERRLKESGLINIAEKAFISSKLGVQKPSIEYFERVAHDVDSFEKEKAVMVGDSLTSDVQGGLNFGVTTIWFNYKRKSIIPPKGVIEVKSFDGLEQALISLACE